MLAFLFGIIACEPHDPVGPQVQRDSTVSAQRVTVYPEERAAWALAQAVPASAGFYIDTASGNVVVSLTTLRQAAAARSVFQSRFASVLAGVRIKRPRAQVVVRQVAFTYTQLARWRDALRGDVFSTPGAVWLDLDEVRNAVVVGLEPGADESTIRRLAAGHSIPDAGVAFEVTGPAVRQALLTDSVRPIAGGTQIQTLLSGTYVTCTLGFPALWNGVMAFVTASHCGRNTFAVDSTKQYQPRAPATHADSLAIASIGFEAADYSETCPPHVGSACAWADAAIYQYTGDPAQWIQGRIARPSAGCFPGPCNPPNLSIGSYFAISGVDSSIVVGDLVSMIGGGTGWNQQYVNKSCVDVKVANGQVAECQDYAGYGQGAGDSGGPILLDINNLPDSSAVLGGLHWGKTGQYSIFSPWSGITREYGNLGVIAVPQDTSRPAYPAAAYFFPSDTGLWIVPPGDTLERLYRTVLGIEFDDSTSGTRVRQVLSKYQATIVAGWSHMKSYGVRVPDPGPTWNAVDSLMRQIRGEAGVRSVFTLSFHQATVVHFRYPNDGAGRTRADWTATPASPDVRPWEAVRAPLAWGCDSSAVLGGLHWGKTGQYSIFSPWSGITREYANLGVIAVPRDTSRPAYPAAQYGFPSDTALYVAPPGDTLGRFYRRVYAIGFDDSTSGTRVRQVLAKYQATIIAGWSHAKDYVVRVPDPGPTWAAVDSLMRQIRAEAGVHEVMPLSFGEPLIAHFRYPNDGAGRTRRSWTTLPSSSDVRPWLAIRAPLAWGCETGAYESSRLRIGVVDFLFDDTHPDLVGSAPHLIEPPDTGLSPNPRLLPDSDLRSHGTEVAGILTATGDNGTGTAGMLWSSDAYLFALARDTKAVSDQAGYVFDTVFPAAESLQVRVLVSSIEPVVGDTAHARKLAEALQHYVSAGSGNMFVQAVGNEKQVLTKQELLTQMPTGVGLLQAAVRVDSTNADNILVVGGTDGANNWWSGTVKGVPVGSNFIIDATDIAAPAESIRVLTPSGDTIGPAGTSLSAPFVAGSAAQLWAFDPTLTPAQVKDFIVRGAQAPRWNPRTGRMETPSAVSGAPGTIYQMDAYSALELAAQRNGAPLCGNRVWEADGAVHVERDPTAHTSESIFPVDEPAGLAVRHGGHWIDVFTDTANIGLLFANGAWTSMADTATLPLGGAYLSMQAFSHGQDSEVTIRAIPFTDSTGFEATIYTFPGGVQHLFDTLWVQTPRFSSSVCVVENDQGCQNSMRTGADVAVQSYPVFAPTGGRYLLAVTYLVTRNTDLGDWNTCPMTDSIHPSTCRTITYTTTSDSTVLYAVNLTSRTSTRLWEVPAEVFWLASAEDGSQFGSGEGTATSSATYGPTSDGGYGQIAGGPTTITNCAANYRDAVAGTANLSVTTSDACNAGLTGQGTISPTARKVASQ